MLSHRLHDSFDNGSLPMAPPEKEPRIRPRHRGLRATTGCLTCRRRHVKCDERRPECANCGKKNRICQYETLADGPAAVSSSAKAPSRRQPSADATSHQVPPDTPIRVIDSNASSPHESQQHEGSQFPAVPVSQNSATSPESPFLTTLGSVLQNTELWSTTGREPETQPRDTPDYADQLGELDYQWQPLHVDEPVQLSGIEIVIYRNYVENVSRWIDSFSHDRPFRNLVSIWALRCPLLLHSCLAFSSKQLILTGSHTEIGLRESDALRYYRLALKKVRQLLMHPQHARSDEILAACIILSSYEMIDGSGENLGSHLKGVVSLLQSRQIQGYASGIRGASYWIWYRHEVWAALQTGRCISLDETYWEPPQVASFENMEIENIANRAIFMLGQCINFSNGYGVPEDMEPAQALQASQARALRLDMALDDWLSKATPFMPCFYAKQAAGTDEQDEPDVKFPIKWFVFPQSAVAHQVYHASKILLALHLPGPLPTRGGLNTRDALSVRRRIEQSREQIFITANAGIPDAWSLVSAQCLYVAGLVTEGSQERKRTLELIDECQQSSGRRTRYIATELQRLWEQS